MLLRISFSFVKMMQALVCCHTLKMKDGDLPHKLNSPEFHGTIYVTCNSGDKNPVDCYVKNPDGTMRLLTDIEEIREEFYWGAYYKLALVATTFDTGKVTFYLRGVLKEKDGDPIGGLRFDSGDMFMQSMNDSFAVYDSKTIHGIKGVIDGQVIEHKPAPQKALPDLEVEATPAPGHRIKESPRGNKGRGRPAGKASTTEKPMNKKSSQATTETKANDVSDLLNM